MRQSARIRGRLQSSSLPPDSNGNATETDPVLIVTSENGTTEPARTSENLEATSYQPTIIPSIEGVETCPLKRKRPGDEDNGENSPIKRQKSDENTPDSNLLFPTLGGHVSSIAPTPSKKVSAVREQDEYSTDNITAPQSRDPTQPASSKVSESEPGPKSTRGRRGGGRARGQGRGRGRGRGGGGAGSRANHSLDLVMSLKARQKALGVNYKKLAAIQKRALAVLGERSQNALMRSKTAHTKVPEYSVIMDALRGLHSEREAMILNEHEYALGNEKDKLHQESDLLERNQRVSLTFPLHLIYS